MNRRIQRLKQRLEADEYPICVEKACLVMEAYQHWTDIAVIFPKAWGGTMKPAGISITSHVPAGSYTGATPDGRYSGETLADGTMSAGKKIVLKERTDSL